MALTRREGEEPVAIGGMYAEDNHERVVLIDRSTVFEITVCFEEIDPRRSSGLVVLQKHRDIVVRLTERDRLEESFTFIDFAIEEHTRKIIYDFIEQIEDEFHNGD